MTMDILHMLFPIWHHCISKRSGLVHSEEGLIAIAAAARPLLLPVVVPAIAEEKHFPRLSIRGKRSFASTYTWVKTEICLSIMNANSFLSECRVKSKYELRPRRVLLAPLELGSSSATLGYNRSD